MADGKYAALSRDYDPRALIRGRYGRMLGGYQNNRYVNANGRRRPGGLSLWMWLSRSLGSIVLNVVSF